jgi:hypothetical protein
MLRLLPFRFGASVFARSRSCKQLTQLAELPVLLLKLLGKEPNARDEDADIHHQISLDSELTLF